MKLTYRTLRAFISDKSAAMTVEYITIAAIGAVVAILFSYQIMGGDDGNSGVSGLVGALTGELDAAATNIEGSVQGAGGS